MPIRVQCSCGQSINVPDALAGKSGKCPKCQQIVRVPAGEIPSASNSSAGNPVPSRTPTAPTSNVPTAKAPSAKVAKVASVVKSALATDSKKSVPSKSGAAVKGSQASVGVSAPSTRNDLTRLLDEAGVSKREGRRCPECDAVLAAQSVFCTKCGFNFELGEKLDGVELENKRGLFKNKVLNEAAATMVEEKIFEKRLNSAGIQWWVILSFLLGGLILAGAGVLIVDGKTTGLQPEHTLVGNLQRLPIQVFLLLVIMIIGGMITVFANLAITATGFSESRTQGWLCVFIPEYTLYYGISRFKKVRGTVIAFGIAEITFLAAFITIIQQISWDGFVRLFN